MSTIVVKLPQRKRNRIQIIRDEILIEKEKILREERLGYFRQQIEEVVEPEIVEEVIEEVVEEIKEPEPIKYTQEFVFSNSNQPIVISLNNIPEPALPVRVVKEEIQKTYERGLLDGQIQAKALFQTELDKYNSWISRFDEIAIELKDAHQVAMKKLEDSIVNIALMVSSHIIGREARESANLVLEMVRKAIASLENDYVFKIHVHPDSVHILEEVKSTLLDDKELSSKIIITSDTSVDEGGCVLETSAGMIDARISSQLEMLKNPLLASIKEIHEKELGEELDEIEDAELLRLREAEEKSMEEMKKLWADEFDENEENESEINNEIEDDKLEIQNHNLEDFLEEDTEINENTDQIKDSIETNINSDNDINANENDYDTDLMNDLFNDINGNE